MKIYLNYLIKTKWLQTIVMALIPTFIFVLSLFLSSPRLTGMNPNRAPQDFGISVIFISIVLIIIVVFRFSGLRSPKEVDLYYALPISRKKLYLVQSLFGFIQLMIVWTIMFLLGIFTLLLISSVAYRWEFILLLYPIVAFYLTVLYGITSFVFLRANTVFDGIAFILLFHILFLFISLFLTNGIIDIFTMFGLNPFYSLSKWTTYLLSLTFPNTSSYIIYRFLESTWSIGINTFIFTALSICAFIYNYKTIEHEKTENIGQISSDIFGYRLYIPLTIIFAVASVFFVETIITWLLIGIFVSAGFIGFFIFRRTAKIKLIDFGYILTPTIIGIILGLLIN
jgi:ABC-2 type transport system permease protein